MTGTRRLLQLRTVSAALACCLALPSVALAGGDFDDWLADLRSEALERGISPDTVAALSDLEPDPKVLELDRSQPAQTDDFSARTISISPSTAAGFPSRPLATRRARCRVGRSSLSPYQRSAAAIAQSTVFSVWHRLHAFGIPSSFVRSGSGMVNPWSRRGSRCMYVVSGMWQLTHWLPAAARS